MSNSYGNANKIILEKVFLCVPAKFSQWLSLPCATVVSVARRILKGRAAWRFSVRHVCHNSLSSWQKSYLKKCVEICCEKWQIQDVFISFICLIQPQLCLIFKCLKKLQQITVGQKCQLGSIFEKLKKIFFFGKKCWIVTSFDLLWKFRKYAGENGMVEACPHSVVRGHFCKSLGISDIYILDLESKLNCWKLPF